MSRIRTIHPSYPDSESLSRVSLEADMLFPRLWSVCDDAGRARADLSFLCHRLFPRRRNMEMMLRIWLDELEREQCIKRYKANDVEYLHVVNWRKYQTICHPTPSKLPAPPNSAKTSREAVSRNSLEEIGKPLMDNEEAAISSKLLEPMKIPRKADGTVDATPEWVKEIVASILVESNAKGSQDTALRAAHWLGRSIGMLPDGRMRPTPGSAFATGGAPAEAKPEVDTGQNDLEEARAAQKPVGQ